MNRLPTFLFATAIAFGVIALSHGQVSQTQAEAALVDHAERFSKAFNQQDAAAVAEFYSKNGTWSDPAAGVRVHTRQAIQEGYEGYFEENPEAKLQLQLTAVKVIADDLAIEEGKATITIPGEAPSISAYTAVHRKNDDGWKMEHVVESQLPEAALDVEPKAPPAGLQDLAWLEGEWIDATETSTIHFENEWVAGGRYLRRQFTVSIEDRVDMTGVEIVGWDPVDERIRSWVFDSEGGFGELRWRQGDEPGIWVKAASATFADGEQASAVHVMRKIDDDTYTFKSVARQRDGLPLPNIDEVTVSRK